MEYSLDMLEIIRDHTGEDNGFSYEEQVEYTQELVEEFFEINLSIAQAEELYNLVLQKAIQ